MPVFFKITQRKNSLSKDGENLYYATSIIRGKTNFYEFCSKVHDLTGVETKTISKVLTFSKVALKEEFRQSRAVECDDNTSIYLLITSKAKKNKNDVDIKKYSKREIIIKPGSALKKFFDSLGYYEWKG